MKIKKYPLLDKIVVIEGPTASGKTQAGAMLASKINGEVISADSRQVYKLMPVITAQPEKSHLKLARHHLVGFLDPGKIYTAGEFAKDAERIIKRLSKKGKNAVVVGGTGLYIKALTEGLSPIPKISPEIKRKYMDLLGRFGSAYLHDKLAKIDPETASVVHPNHSSRIIRALEVFDGTGRTISQWHKVKPSRRFNYIKFYSKPSKDQLLKRIKKRSHNMLKKGMIEETKLLVKKGFTGINALGFTEAVKYLNGSSSKEELLNRLILETKQYAKRQQTWFNSSKDLILIKMNGANQVVGKILKHIKL